MNLFGSVYEGFLSMCCCLYKRLVNFFMFSTKHFLINLGSVSYLSLRDSSSNFSFLFSISNFLARSDNARYSPESITRYFEYLNSTPSVLTKFNNGDIFQGKLKAIKKSNCLFDINRLNVRY